MIAHVDFDKDPVRPIVIEEFVKKSTGVRVRSHRRRWPYTGAPNPPQLLSEVIDVIEEIGDNISVSTIVEFGPRRWRFLDRLKLRIRYELRVAERLDLVTRTGRTKATRWSLA